MSAGPDTLGQPLAGARELLEEAGWQIAQVDETRPPAKYRRPRGPLRVVQQRQVGPGQVVLVVAREISLKRQLD